MKIKCPYCNKMIKINTDTLPIVSKPKLIIVKGKPFGNTKIGDITD